MSSKTIKEVLERHIREEEYITKDYWQEDFEQTLLDIQEIIKECIGEMEYRNTEDMSLSTWSAEDLKAFGRNELRNEIMNNLEKRLK